MRKIIIALILPLVSAALLTSCLNTNTNNNNKEMTNKCFVPKGRFSEPIAVAQNNWPEAYPYSPKVTVAVRHDGQTMTLRYNVTENYTKAEITESNGQVWTDSCVEFFISFDQNSYYNIETTCAGVELLGLQTKSEGSTKYDVSHASNEIIAAIKKTGTYVGQCFSEREGENSWQIDIEIPVSSFYGHAIKSFDGLKARCNFYKCGDNLSHPHFLSWTKISFQKPNFHLPEFFGEIEFE